MNIMLQLCHMTVATCADMTLWQLQHTWVSIVLPTFLSNSVSVKCVGSAAHRTVLLQYFCLPLKVPTRSNTQPSFHNPNFDVMGCNPIRNVNVLLHFVVIVFLCKAGNLTLTRWIPTKGPKKFCKGFIL